jgi:Domain of unknown function (DUF4157)/Lysine-specific metallo-endopeptidase
MFATQNSKKESAGNEPAAGQVDRVRHGEASISNPLWQALAFSSLPVVQPKLTVSQPDDPFEREADNVADRVMRMAEPGGTALSFTPLTSLTTQRKCGACTEEEDEEDKNLQRKESHDAPQTATPQVSATLNTTGQPLDRDTRSFMEDRFGHDFGNVRTHVDNTAAESAASVRARAYTVGNNIVFGRGEYAPSSAEGRRLIAHELAHVMQQTGPTGPALTTQRTPDLRVQRIVDPEYVVSERATTPPRPGTPLRIFFVRNSAVIPFGEQSKIDGFKSGADQTVDITLFGLATEDELAAIPTLPLDRANAVRAALNTPLINPPHTRHTGLHTPLAGALANTRERANIRFNRCVEILRPGETTLSPSTPIAAPTACSPAIETAFQAAKTMAFNWIRDTRTELAARPITGTIATDLDRFFGNHQASTARRVHHNLNKIRDELRRLAQPAHHDCADPNLPSCVSALAFNSGGHMTLCQSITTRGPEEVASVIFHEACHSTPGLRITGLRNVNGTSDFAYRQERLVHLLGLIDPDQALSNSDSYSMLLMSRRAPASIPPQMLPATDPAPTGFANASDSLNTQRAVALAEVWIRLARQGITDLHGDLRNIGTGSAIPPDLGDPRRMDLILREVPVRFPPILAGPNFTGDDLLMLAGVIDSYAELGRLIRRPIAMSPGATTAFTRVVGVGGAPPSLTLTVDAAFLGATEQVRARTIVDRLIERLSIARISVGMRANYAEYAEFSRNLHQ